jgi:hypothetical protein
MSGAPEPASAPRPLVFQDLWRDAFLRYKEVTGHDLLRISSLNQLLYVDSVEAIIHVLESHDKSFKAFRTGGKNIRAVLSPVMRLVGFFTDVAAEAASATVRIPQL